MDVSVSCLPFSACCHHVGPFLVSLAELPGEISGAGLVILAAPACGTGEGENSAGLAGIQKRRICPAAITDRAQPLLRQIGGYRLSSAAQRELQRVR